jgi:hypothetical protein
LSSSFQSENRGVTPHINQSVLVYEVLKKVYFSFTLHISHRARNCAIMNKTTGNGKLDLRFLEEILRNTEELQHRYCLKICNFFFGRTTLFLNYCVYTMNYKKYGMLTK